MIWCKTLNQIIYTVLINMLRYSSITLKINKQINVQAQTLLFKVNEIYEDKSDIKEPFLIDFFKNIIHIIQIVFFPSKT